MEVVDKIIQKILTSKNGLYYVITGGGTRAISLLLENGGASSVFIGARVPYSQDETNDLTWGCPKSVSQKCAEALSKVGFNTAIEKDKIGVCIASTSSLAKNGKEREDGVHEAFISIREYDKRDIKNKVISYHIIFGDKTRTRKQEEDILSHLILAITCQYTTKCEWVIETHTKLTNAFGLNDKDSITLLKQDKKSDDEDDNNE